MNESRSPTKVFTKKAFFNFYGAMEAEDLEEARVIDIACDLGEIKEPFLSELCSREEFLKAPGILGDTRDALMKKAKRR